MVFVFKKNCRNALKDRNSVNTILAIFPIMADSLQSEPQIFHVSPNGNDQWSGLLSDPNQDRSDGPFATLRQAQNTVRQLNPWPSNGVNVIVHEGNFSLTESLTFGEEDSGSASAPVIWKAAPGAKPKISGGITLPNLQPIDDPSLLARLPEISRNKVLWSDLNKKSITDIGMISQNGPPGLEVFCQGIRMPRARYPREGWLKIADVPQSGPTRFHEGLDREKRFHNVPVGRHFGRISYDDGRPSSWSIDNQIFLHGYWTWDWADSFQQVKSINLEKREITIAEPHHTYGYTTNQRYAFLNVFEEIQAPGDWAIDYEKGYLFFYPPEKLDLTDIVISILDKPLFSLKNTNYLKIEGLHFTTSRGQGISIAEGENIQVTGCTFNNLGDTAITIDGGHGHLVDSCDLYHLAGSGIHLKGGDRETLTPSDHEIRNNHIHHFSEWLQTRKFGILFDGVGHRIAHNCIHDSPFEAMYLRGNDHVIEFNEVFHVIRQSGDAGALHTGRDYTWQGNIIRHNYWHHLEGPGLHGVMGVYLDDFSTGFTVYGNIFYKAGRATLLSGGHDNIVENNLYIDCAPSIHYDARGLSWAHYYFNGKYTWLWDRYHELNADQPPYVERYPALKTMLEDEPAVPKRNRIARNISLGSGRWIDVYDFHAFDFYQSAEVYDNLLANPGICRRRTEPEDFWDPYYLNIDGQEGYTLFLNDDPQIHQELSQNTIVAEAPLSFDPVSLQVTPHDPALLEKIKFQPIPTKKIGLQKNKWRQQLPERIS